MTVPVLEIGGTHVTAALVDLASGAVVPGSLRRDQLDPGAPAEPLLAAILACGASLAAPPGAAWGVATPGPFDYERGVALFAGVAKFDALYGVDLRSALTSGLPKPPGSVSFLNDASAFLLGEWLFGAASDHDRCVGVTLGTGVGSCFLVNGMPKQTGPGVPPEGRVDLLEIDGRPLEDTVSRRAIRTAYANRLCERGHDMGDTHAAADSNSDADPDVAEIARRAGNGDQDAHAILSTAFTALGAALGPRLVEFGATALVIGGSMTGSWELIEPSLRAGLERSAPGATPGAVPAPRPAAHPQHAALLGAAAHAAGPRPCS